MCLVSWPLTVTVINTGVRPTNLVGLELRTKDGVAFSVGPRSSHGVIPYWGPELPQLLGDGEQVMLELDLVQAYKAGSAFVVRCGVHERGGVRQLGTNR